MNSEIQLLRSAEKTVLTDPDLLKHLLLRIGLKSYGPDLARYYPASLWPHVDKGLRCWQYPIQFSKYLIDIARMKISSYLEIGMSSGGSFIITVEFLNRFHPLKRAVGVDQSISENIARYSQINPIVSAVCYHTSTPEFRTFMARQGTFDLGFVDGGHSFHECFMDSLIVIQKAKAVVLHDIASDVEPDVGKVWQKLKQDYWKTHRFREYTDQYPGIQGRYMGIGLMVRKPRVWDLFGLSKIFA